VNPQEVACYGRGNFPPEKLPCEIISVLKRQRQDWMALSREAGNLSVELTILISFQPQIDKESVRAIGGR